jgi:hypothetical protein
MAVRTEGLSEDTSAPGVGHELPPPAAMMGLITGYWVSQAVGVVAQLGVADQLGPGPRTGDELDRVVGEALLHRWPVPDAIKSTGELVQKLTDDYVKSGGG